MIAALIITFLSVTSPGVRASAASDTLPPPEVPGHQHPAGGENLQTVPEHLHPQPSPEPEQVGLEERLGDYIPLDAIFRDETGRSVALKDLIDGPTVIAPVYYKCPNVCTFIQGSLAQTLPEVALRPGEEYRVLSISFDETDTPAIAEKSKRNYFSAMRRQYPQDAWRFLSGDAPQIRRLTDSLGYYFQRRGVDFLHPVAIAVVARDGKIVRYHYGTRFLPMDLTLSLVEGSQGKVGTTIKRVLGYCFSYDAANRRYVFNILKVSATVVLVTLGSFLAFLLLSGRRSEKHGPKS